MDSESSVAVAMSYYNTICFQKGESRAGGGSCLESKEAFAKAKQINQSLYCH